MKILFEITIANFILGGVLILLASLKSNSEERRKRAIKYFMYLPIVMAVLCAAYAGELWLFGLMIIIIFMSTLEINSALKKMVVVDYSFLSIVWLGYGVLSISYLLSFCLMSPTVIAFIYTVIAIFDGFSQATGQLFGRHKIAKYISPNKTLEGCIGGLVAAVCMAIFARSVVNLSVFDALCYGVLISFSGLCGDLTASWLKRRAGIKDYGTILLEHGGILDRFDSFIVAVAACDILLILIKN